MRSSFSALHYSTQGLITSRLNQGYHFLFRLCTSVWLPNKSPFLFFFFSSFRFRDVSPEAERRPGCRLRRCCVGTVGCFVFFPETEVRRVTCPFDTKPWIIDVLAKVLVALQWRRTFTRSLYLKEKQAVRIWFDFTIQVILLLLRFLGSLDWVSDLNPSRCELMIWCLCSETLRNC